MTRTRLLILPSALIAAAAAATVAAGQPLPPNPSVAAIEDSTTPFATSYAPLTDPILEARGIRYACTGVGNSSETDPRWPSFSTKLVFASKEGVYLADAAVRIRDNQGNEVFSAQCATPWVLVDLPTGTYDVHAIARGGHVRSLKMHVDQNAQTTQVIHFAGINIPGHQ